VTARHGDRFVSGPVELRPGRWQDVLADTGYANLLLTDPPYSPRVHSGQRSGNLQADESTISYLPMTAKEAFQIATFWSERITDWAVIFCDHESFAWHESAWVEHGWRVFAPVRWVKPDSAPRKCSDGPACSTEDIMIARRDSGWPRIRGSRPGHYEFPCSELRGCGLAGSKPLGLILAILSDYSMQGDYVFDPYAGLATTLVASGIEGRRAIGAELDPITYEKAVNRIKRGWTPRMQLPPAVKPKQAAMF